MNMSTKDISVTDKHQSGIMQTQKDKNKQKTWN